MTTDDRNRRPDRHRINRRRLLQSTGVTVGSLPMTTFGNSTAQTANSCAKGPFERTYTAETVNISRIATDRRDHASSTDDPSATEVRELLLHRPPSDQGSETRCSTCVPAVLQGQSQSVLPHERWEVTDSLDDPSVACQVIHVDSYTPIVEARQPGTDLVIHTLGGRLMNLDYQDGSLWTAQTISYNWDDGTNETVAAIRWYEIDASTAEVVQSGTYGAPGTSYHLPHVASAGDRTLMGYNVSGPERFPNK